MTKERETKKFHSNSISLKTYLVVVINFNYCIALRTKKKTQRLEATCQSSSLHVKVKEKSRTTNRHHIYDDGGLCHAFITAKKIVSDFFFFKVEKPRERLRHENSSDANVLRQSLVASMFDVMHCRGAITAPTGRLTLWPLKHLCASVLTGSTSIRASTVCSSQGAIRINVKQETQAKLAD